MDPVGTYLHLRLQSREGLSTKACLAPPRGRLHAGKLAKEDDVVARAATTEEPRLRSMKRPAFALAVRLGLGEHEDDT